MRMLAVCQCSWRHVTSAGGAETMIDDLCQHLALNGWDVDAVIIGQDRSTAVVGGVSVHTRRSTQDFDDLARNADVILTHLGGTPMAKKVGRRFGKPVVQLIHNTNKFSVGFLGSGCDFAVYNANWVSSFHDDQKSQTLIESWEDRTISHLMVRQAKEWPSIVVRPPASGELYPPVDGSGAVTLVNLTPNKGPKVLYELASRNPDIQFMGVLGGYDIDKQMIRHLPNVTIHPHTADTAEFYSKSSIVLMPSAYESYGCVAIEAARWGIPTVASPTPGLKESLGPAGVFADRKNIDEWEAALSAVREDYPFHQEAVRSRFVHLREQTEMDLAVFTDIMGLVGCGNY